MSKTLVTILFALTLAGCKARAVPDAQPPATGIFAKHMQQALIQTIATTDSGRHVGVVRLRITLDANSAPIACKAQPSPGQEKLLPAGVPLSNFKALARLVEAQCWKTIYPRVPAALYGAKDTVDVIAPLVVMLPAADPASLRGQANAQRAFFWQHLLRDQPVTSVGNVSVYYQGNAQGKVEQCLVQIHPHPLRPADFRLDSELQARLNARCLATNLSLLPGYSANANGVAEGYSELEYAPWRVGRP